MRPDSSNTAFRGKSSHRVRVGIMISAVAQGFKTLGFVIIDRSLHHLHLLRSTKGNILYISLEAL